MSVDSISRLQVVPMPFSGSFNTSEMFLIVSNKLLYQTNN